MNDMQIIDWGTIPYDEAHARQKAWFAEALEAKQHGAPVINRWISCRHNPVITLGKHADHANLLFSSEALKARGVELAQTERGGDVTYHGPGQLVVYPIIDLEAFGLGLRDYIHFLEEAVIRTIARYGIRGERVDGATGVWIEVGTPRERKICAIGVKSSRYVTMHGLALNVTTDLDYFRLINPCGFVDKGVTSILLETGRPLSVDEVADELRNQAQQLLPCRFFR
jgi:lipoyl(octanoyl) transferase